MTKSLTAVLLALVLGPGLPAPAAETGVLAPGAKLEKLAGGFEFTEGPTCDAAGNLFFTDQPNDRILKWSTDGKLSTFLQPAGRSNGLCFDAAGPALACADEENELWSSTRTASATIVVKDYQGKALNGPNDVWVRPGGGLYFTDPFYNRPWWTHHACPRTASTSITCRRTEDADARGRRHEATQRHYRHAGRQDPVRGRHRREEDLVRHPVRREPVQQAVVCNMGSDGMTIDDRGDLYLTGKA